MEAIYAVAGGPPFASRPTITHDESAAEVTTYTAKEIEELAPADEHCQEQIVHRLEDAVAAYAELRKKCQKQASSMLVPMGQEGSYRYQEDQIEDMLTAVRAFRSRIKEEMK